MYSLRLILLFANTDVSITKMCLDTSTLAKSIMGRREYFFQLEYVGCVFGYEVHAAPNEGLIIPSCIPE
jgi:hypothetical protein